MNEDRDMPSTTFSKGNHEIQTPNLNFITSLYCVLNLVSTKAHVCVSVVKQVEKIVTTARSVSYYTNHLCRMLDTYATVT